MCVCVGDLSVVALEVASVLKGEGGEDLDEVCVGRCKQVTTVTEGTLDEREGKMERERKREREREKEGERNREGERKREGEREQMAV